MTDRVPSLSTDQVAAFAELARHGSLRAAAGALHLTEQGVRNRLVALEARLGVPLYHKQRGPRRRSPLTPQGEQFLPHALAFLDGARRLGDVFRVAGPSEVHVAATQYLTTYVLIDAVRAFHAAHPNIRVRLSTRTERDVEDALRRDPDLALGVAAPYDAGGDLTFRHLFALDWGLVTPLGHPLGGRRSVGLADLADVPLILFERGSTGRQHVLDAFHAAGISPRVDMEATTTAVVVQMVEAGLGVSVVPLMPGGAVTRGRKVRVRHLAGLIRPIDSGVLTRRGDAPRPEAEAFVKFLEQAVGRKRRTNKSVD